MTAGRPVVCVLPPGPPSRAARLADIVVTTDAGGSAADRCAMLLAACPGLSAVVVICSDGSLSVGVRHGAPPSSSSS